MNMDKEVEKLFDNLRKLAFFVGHGKYNDYMSSQEVEVIKAKLEQIMEIEKKYLDATLQEEKERIFEHIETFKTFTLQDFINYNSDLF